MPSRDHPPSIRQQRFAAGLVAGKRITQAYVDADPERRPGRNKKATLDADAKKAAKQPAVQREVARLMKESTLLPAIHDGRAIQEYAVKRILDLSQSAQNEAVAFKASEWLHEYGTQ